MRLTLHADFALRVFIQVGLNEGKLTTIKEIAQTFYSSKAHLMKVVNALSQKGYLDTVHGRNGGIRANRETSKSEKWCATLRSSTLLAALNIEATVPSNGFAYCAAS